MESYVFLDFEFTCSEDRYSRSGREILSMAAVFTDKRGNIIDKYYSIVKPSKFKNLSIRCVKLTNINQHQADSSPYFDEVYERFISLTELYKTTKMFVWGTADRVIVEKSLRFAKFGSIKRKYHCFINYQDIFMQYIKKEGNLKQQISLESAAYICDFDFTHEFNALGDAQCLRNVFFAVRDNKINKHKLKKYIEYNDAVNYVSLYKNKQNRLKTLISNNNEIIMRLQGNECQEREALEKKLATNKDLCNSLRKYIDENILEYTDMVSFVNKTKYVLTKR